MSPHFRTSRLFLFILLCGGVFALFYFLGTNRVGPSPSLKDTSELGEDILIKGVRLFELKGDKLLWSIDANEARFFQPKGVVQFDTMKATFYPSQGGDMVLTAREGYYETATRNMSAEGGVMGVSDQGYQFWTQSFTYDASTREIHSADKVTLKKDRLTIEGVGLEGHLETRTIRMLSSVKAVYSFP